MLNNYDIGDKILKQLEDRLDEDALSVEDLNIAAIVMLNIRETRLNNVPVAVE